MTDWAAVMKKFDADLLQFIRTQVGQETAVHFLRCNAHYLLGLSQSTELALQAAEKAARETAPVALGRDQHAKFGFFKSKEIATFKLIRTASDVTGLQGDQKKQKTKPRCHMEWLAYCKEKEMGNRMTSHRSNYFNSFFEGAAMIIHHRRTLLSFFWSFGHSNLKMPSVEADLADNRLLLFVAAVALLYIHLTGPKQSSTLSCISTSIPWWLALRGMSFF